ncbi:FtsX-like permease family protein [Mucilaginibacter gossypii]|uniref:ABC transporter permease n=1 Tax=Mucilaginibacter gossypii TaxID=551996 RepID=UPI000DCF1837|nr:MULTISPECIES: ABC transporter permease [Mucilaginibacter]QTE37908.1 FtsX-like permease family protein [Mucilaginibacter gossypii]RAV48005.1 ABC transporter permease [Mucilaginibacter rubeus]
MLKNYLKIAIAVLKRRKFFTFISLFGISFTLTILIVLTAFIDKVIGDNYPDKKRDRSLYITRIQESGDNNMMSSTLSYYFLSHYTSMMKTPVKVAISSMFKGTNTYVNNKKIAVNFKYTNADYWDVLDYDFTEGKPFNKQQVSNADRVAIISEDMKRQYFGDVTQVVGKYIEADNVNYRVIGVVKNVPVTNYMLYSDIYLPYTVSKEDYKSKGYLGGYLGILLANSPGDVPKMKAEYENIIKRVPVERKEFKHLYSHANTFFRSYVDTGNEEHSGVFIVVTAISIFVFIFTLLPTLNLVNINITRIMERSSEIGVRKAFGASSKTLVYQFIVENLILTLLGGLIGIVLSLIVLSAINNANLIANLELSINFTVLFIGLLVCLVFGLLSGVYPAWRMSKLNVVTALKA